MPLGSLVHQLQQSALTIDLAQRTRRGQQQGQRLCLRGGARVARALVTSAVARQQGCSLLVVTPTVEEAGRWTALLDTMGWPTVLFYPTSEATPYESLDPTSEITYGQLQVFAELLRGQEPLVVVASERALQPHLPPKVVLQASCLTMERGNATDLTTLARRLGQLGYERVSTVEQEGTWSRRGDIVDVYPVSAELPVRLEFFGDELEKLREFDPASQRSLDTVEQLWLTPRGYDPLIAQVLRTAAVPAGLQALVGDQALASLRDGETPKGLRRLLGAAFPQPATLLDYMPGHGLVVVDERRSCLAHGQQWVDHAASHLEDLRARMDPAAAALMGGAMHWPMTTCLEQVDRREGFDLAELDTADSRPHHVALGARPVPCLPNQFGKLGKLVRDQQRQRTHLWLLSAQPSRTVALLEEHDAVTRFVPNAQDRPAIAQLLEQGTPVVLKAKGLAEMEGVSLPAWKVMLLTDREIFGQQSLASSGYVRRRRRAASRTVDPCKLQPGDHVVHRLHGIGRFLKLEKLSLSGEPRDYLVVQYTDGLLRVAADQLGSLGRYRASGEQPPQLNRMGGSAWKKAKERARKAVARVAMDLVKLYAERHEARGHAFAADGPWQADLEGSFPYDPTPDQLKAITDMKQDMEAPRPMDRLVCGDVGFGKTEVAVRGIFKCVTDGKQCALLAPTTVLAQQHWRTIRDRFAPYPVKVGLLNRFRTATERRELLQQLAEGTLDVVVGTHQLLGKGTVFRDLGLVVVDEEQRFGVKQKEKLKTLRKAVDVLTLSATPIPRTLYMSLSSMREMSLIATPPPSRRPIKTHLLPMDDEVVRSAMRQELDRGGQIFYVVPRIEGIGDVAAKLQRMDPGLRLLVAHGQMGEGQLEATMLAFNDGEADLLVCTTIVESGLDIPRVNTILVEDAHRFGLASLYQLRGRVGRRGVQAHAWLFYPNEEKLTPAARSRLRAIQEFAQLGSGYQLAMRDMEIRGAGNLLGMEQSGQMEAIGFDLYMEMLQECLAEIRGQDIPQVEDTQVDLRVPAFLPGVWIADGNEKMAAYRAAANCRSPEELLALAAAWSDRYGPLPAPVQTLLQLMELKLLAKRCGVSRIRPEKANIILDTPLQEPAFRRLRQGLPQHLHGRLIYQAGDMTARIIARGLGSLPAPQQLTTVMEWLQAMAGQLPGLEQKKAPAAAGRS